MALVGDNGAGKSTLVKVLAGVHAPTSGTIHFHGEPVTMSGPSDALKLGIATVYQDLSLCENLDVVANLFLGQELNPWQLDEVAMEVRAWTLLGELAARIPSVREPIASLSGGQRQTVAIARSLLLDPHIVMLDEPTAALGVAQTAEVLNLIERLRDRGHGVIMISHNMEDVRAVADRIVVLRLGRNNGIFTPDSSNAELVGAITGATDNAVSRRAARRGAEDAQEDPAMSDKPRLLDRSDTRVAHSEGLAGSVNGFLDRVRSGDLGSLPVVVGLLIIWTVFYSLNPIFLSPNNMVNLFFDCSVIGVIALGIVCVLLLGEIDLSVGSMSGVASTLLGVLWVNQGWPLLVAIAVALAVGACVGAIYALLRTRLSMPSFVSTLSGLLALLGLQLYLLGPTGSINLPYDSAIVAFGQLLVMPAWLSHALALIPGIVMLVVGLRTMEQRRRANLSPGSLAALLVKAAALTAGLEFVVYYLNLGRGVPWMFGLFVLLVVAMQYGFTRTKWGRSMMAVGGNAEAARRAGINVRGSLHQRLHGLLDVRGARRRALGVAARHREPAGGHRRRQPQRHRRGGDRRHQPVRRPRQRLVGPARDHRHPVDLERADAAEPVVVAPLHDYRRRSRNCRDRRQPRTQEPRLARPRLTQGKTNDEEARGQSRRHHRRGLRDRTCLCERDARGGGDRRPRRPGRRQARRALRRTRAERPGGGRRPARRQGGLGDASAHRRGGGRPRHLPCQRRGLHRRGRDRGRSRRLGPHARAQRQRGLPLDPRGSASHGGPKVRRHRRHELGRRRHPGGLGAGLHRLEVRCSGLRPHSPPPACPAMASASAPFSQGRW